MKFLGCDEYRIAGFEIQYFVTEFWCEQAPAETTPLSVGEGHPNFGMIATGNHVIGDSLRGAPPSRTVGSTDSPKTDVNSQHFTAGRVNDPPLQSYECKR